MEVFWEGLGIAAIPFGFFAGLAVMIHGFNFITINKHYHTKEPIDNEQICVGDGNVQARGDVK